MLRSDEAATTDDNERRKEAMSKSLGPLMDCPLCIGKIFTKDALEHARWHAMHAAAPPTAATERRRAPGWVIDEATNLDDAGLERLCSIVPDPPRWSRQTFATIRPASPARCATCTHVHVGPCNGTSPNGHFSCPCGHPKVAARVEMRETFPLTRGHRMDMHDEEGMDRERAGLGRAGRAMLLANLSREKPPGRRPIRTVARYEGNSDD